MDKTILKNFAIYARNKLIQDIKNKASMIGISEKGIRSPLSESTSDMLAFDIGTLETYKIYDKEVDQYKKLVAELNKRKDKDSYDTAYDTLIEEVAYTWFNRLIAIRFMEVNNYLPDKMRVLSSGREGVNEPEFVTNYIDTGLSFTDKELEQLSNWKLDGSAKSMENLFHHLFIKQCNALNENLPELFEKTDDYAELLLTISYNDQEGVLYKLVHGIPEEYFDVESEDGNGQVEIIGWMYQYYNTEKKDEVINVIGKNTVKKQDIPAATQLFTTDWVVRYMVDNSLGKYWLERNPDSNVRNSLEYLMPGEIPVVDEKISPEDIKIFDNAMGSGHCLSYAFDVLLMIYESEGYTSREASRLIVEKNLYGLDIDKRAYQLAYFAIMMKARQYNRRALNGELKTNLRVFEDSKGINKEHLNYLGLSINPISRKLALNQINYLIDEFENATEIGSILRIDNIDTNLLFELIKDNSSKGQIAMVEVNIEKTQEQLGNLIEVASMLTKRYEVMVTNPPYLNKFSSKLKKYINDNYRDYKGDMFSVFIFHNLELCKPKGYSAYMTPNVWMFIKTYEELREYLISQKHIDSLIQIAKGAFYKEATVDVMTFVIKNCVSTCKGKYIKLESFKGDMEVQRVKTLETIQNPEFGYYYATDQENFKKIPGVPIAYWVNKSIIDNYSKRLLGDYGKPRTGMTTGDNGRFLRMWFEIDFRKSKIGAKDKKDAIKSKKKWFPYSKGGGFRRWYGYNEYFINWENDGFEIKNNIKDNGSKAASVRSENLYFKRMISWSAVTSYKFSTRLIDNGSLFDSGGSSLFVENNIEYILALLNSNVSQYYLDISNATLNYQPGDIANVPVIIDDNNKENIEKIAEHSIQISNIDWDSFETSWNYKMHPLVDKNKKEIISKTLEQCYSNWKQYTNSQFDQLKINEEELNRIFIEIYGLEDQLTPQVSDKDITITKIFDTKDEVYGDIKGNQYILTKEDVIKSFISYAVGCMFGRYSLDVEGLAYTGGELYGSKYISLIPTKDNVLLITDEEYFEDDIVNRFIEFVKVVYGEDTLKENLEFIAGALGGKDSPKDVIRNYFIKDFFNDHVKKHQKRPIYWQYDSGKQNGFKAIIYMHRYNEDTTGKVRIDYLHKMQKAYERAIDNLNYDIGHNDNPREVAKLEKRLTKITKQLKECKDYDEKISHLALARIPIDLDDGVKVNHDKIQTDEKGKNLNILAKIK